MFKLALISIVIVPVLLGTEVAKRTKGRRGLLLLLALVLTFDVLFMVMLLYLRVRWLPELPPTGQGGGSLMTSVDDPHGGRDSSIQALRESTVWIEETARTLHHQHESAARRA